MEQVRDAAFILKCNLNLKKQPQADLASAYVEKNAMYILNSCTIHANPTYAFITFIILNTNTIQIHL